MSAPILVAYATKYGSTREVAGVVAARLRDEQLEVELAEARDVTDLTEYCGVVLGGALYAGRLHREAREFLARHRNALAVLPVAVFALGPMTLEPADLASARAQLAKALEKTPDVRPYEVAVFGGAIKPKTLPFPFNHMRASDARDWDDIGAFAFRCARAYDFGKAAAAVGDLRSEVPQTYR